MWRALLTSVRRVWRPDAPRVDVQAEQSRHRLRDAAASQRAVTNRLKAMNDEWDAVSRKGQL